MKSIFLRMGWVLPFFSQWALAAQNRNEPVEGSFNWHYSPGNTVMQEGHRKIREWRQQIREERERQMAASIFAPPPSGPGDVIPPPLALGTEHSFANGMLRGKWNLVYITNETSTGGYGSGVRLDRTVYDPAGNRIYALNTEGNLSDAPLVQGGAWVVRNHAVIIEKTGFTGVRAPAGNFRLIGSVNNILHYSDDHGVTWVEAANGLHDRATITWAESMADGNILALVRKRVGTSVQDVLLRSTDYGVSYSDFQVWPSGNGVAGTRLYNTSGVCVLIRALSTGTWEVWRYENGAIARLSTTAATERPSSITGTEYQGMKIYVGVSGGGYYSDGGITWVRRATLQQRIETVHPNQPGLIFSRQPEHDYSTDGGVTWQTYSGNDNTIGWDPKHLTFYQINGVWTFVAANDMGLCWNTDVLNRTTWRYTNNNHSYAILHGGSSVDHTALNLTANQDPGTFELTRTGRGLFRAINRQSADGLRVAASNNGRAYWYRHYWDAFFHSHAAFTGNTARKVSISVPGDWFTPPFKGSTTPNEDAIYVSGQAQLFKLTYNAAANTISRTDLPYNFQTSAGDLTWGVGTAKSDPNRLYVATRNGRFFRSTNAGQSWTETTYAGTKPTPQNSPAYNQSTGFFIEVGDENPDLVFWGAGSGSAAVLISRDGGATFTPAVTGLPTGERVANISLSPDGRLAFSTNFFMYVASDNRWYDMKAPSMPTGALPAAVGVNYLPLQRKVRYYTWGTGVLDFDVTYLNTTEVREFTFDPTRCYEITAAHSRMDLSVEGGSTAAGANVLQGTPTGALSQRWQFTNLDGFLRITNVGSQKVLEVADSSLNDGANVRQGNWTGADYQHWNVMRNADGSYAVAARNSVKALSVAGAATTNGTNVQQSFYFGNPGQKWSITEDAACMAVDVRSRNARSEPGLFITRGSSQGIFRVVYGAHRGFDIEVRDASGRLMSKATNTNVVDLSAAQTGVYYVKIFARGVLVAEKLVMNF